MKKKNKKNLKALNLGVILLAVVALVSLFLPAVSMAALDQAWTGLQVVFGYTKETNVVVNTVKTEICKFSFMNLLTYLLVVATAVFAFLSYTKKNKLALLLTVVCALTAGVFFLLTKNFVVLPINNELAYEGFRESYKLAAGPIVGAVCMFLSGLVAGTRLVLEK